jgi:hypothetical protein
MGMFDDVEDNEEDMGFTVAKPKKEEVKKKATFLDDDEDEDEFKPTKRSEVA